MASVAAQQVMQLYEAGLNYRQIGQFFGIKASTAKRMVAAVKREGRDQYRRRNPGGSHRLLWGAGAVAALWWLLSDHTPQPAPTNRSAQPSGIAGLVQRTTRGVAGLLPINALGDVGNTLADGGAASEQNKILPGFGPDHLGWTGWMSDTNGNQAAGSGGARWGS